MVSTAQQMKDEPRVMRRPLGAPAAINTHADYNAWLPDKMRRNIRGFSGPTNFADGLNIPGLWFRLTENRHHEAQPISWIELQKMPWNMRRTLNGLATANQHYAAEAAANMPIANVDEIAQTLSMQPSYFATGADNEAHRRGAVAAYMGAVATHLGVSIPYVKAPAKVAGSGSVVSELWNDAKDWVNDSVIKPLAAVVKDAAAYILSFRNDSGFAKFFLDAAGISILFSALEQTSAAVEAGDWSKFDDEAFLIVAGETFVASGTVMAVLGAVFPPLAIVAAAISAASISLGQSILSAQGQRQQKDVLREIEPGLKQAQEQAAQNLADAQAVADAATQRLDTQSGTQAQTPTRSKKPLIIAASLAAGGFSLFTIWSLTNG